MAKNEDAAPLKAFLGEHYCLIVEPSSAFASSFQSSLLALGVPLGKILVVRKLEEARLALNEKKPKLLITEFEIDKGSALSLIEIQEKFYGDLERIAIVVTGNSADSSVAEAAEEQVDAFLLKPFSVDTFRQKLAASLERKCRPTSYQMQLVKGKKLLAQKSLVAAGQAFTLAKSLDDKPALACYYTGVVLQAAGDVAGALTEYREGRTHHSLHYYCLVAEFELLLESKQYEEAVRLVAILKKNFPLTPHRLGQIFVASVFARQFQDILEYHDLFCRFEQRPAELIKIVSMALFTAGKHCLQNRELIPAMERFEKGFSASAYEFAFLERVVRELLKAEAIAQAQTFLKKAPPSMIGSAEYNRLAFKIDAVTLNSEPLITRGRKLVMDGQGDPEIFETLVRLMGEAGKKTLAESVISRALVDFPDLRADLYQILEKASTKS